MEETMSGLVSRISVGLYPHQEKALRDWSEVYGISRTGIMRDALDFWISMQEASVDDNTYLLMGKGRRTFYCRTDKSDSFHSKTIDGAVKFARLEFNAEYLRVLVLKKGGDFKLHGLYQIATGERIKDQSLLEACEDW